MALAFQQFICKACGLIYDEAKGDADSGLAPGTRFADIPDDWACPLCGVTKADFEPYETEPLSPPRKRGTNFSSLHRSHHGQHSQRGDAGIVIVGGGRAGWQTARALRDLDAEVAITLVTACSGNVYDKPHLSVALAKGTAMSALVRETAADAAARLRVRLLAHTHAVSVSASAQALRTTRGTLRYRELVLAHGAAPRAVAQLPAALCWRINHLDAYVALRKQLGTPNPDAPQQVLIAGAGLVGCELANDLALAGHSVTLLEVSALPLSHLLDEQASHELLTAWQGLPLRFIGGVQITGVSARADGRTVQTAEGRVFNVDHVIAATGLETPSRLARSAGLAWDNGIAVDPQNLRTSEAHIHALGDCISIHGQPMRFIEPIDRQARLVAANVAANHAGMVSGTVVDNDAIAAIRATAAVYDHRPPLIRIKTTSRPFSV